MHNSKIHDLWKIFNYYDVLLSYLLIEKYFSCMNPYKRFDIRVSSQKIK